MRKTTVAALLATAIGISQPAMAGGIPVIDVAGLTQNILQVQHMLQQIESLRSQLETANKELDSISGSRGLAGVIDSVYDTTVDVNPDEVLDEHGIQGGSHYGGLTEDEVELYDTGNRNAAEWLAQSDKSLEQVQERFHDLTGLVAQVNDSPDQKDILDLQARIGAEEVLLENEMAKLTMLRSRAEARQAVHQRQVQQMSLDSSGDLREVSW